MLMDDDRIHFFDDDGEEIRPDLIAKPGLCLGCAKDDDPAEEPLCALIRLDQDGEVDFRCDAFERKDAR
ncbi:hypothetical protein ACYOEI_03230 [Singulisphaera rosea]